MALQWDNSDLQILLSHFSGFPHWLAHILTYRWLFKGWLLRNTSSSLSHCFSFRIQLPIKLNDWWPSDFLAQLGRCNNQFHKNMGGYKILKEHYFGFFLINYRDLVLLPSVCLWYPHLLLFINWNLCSIPLYAAYLWIPFVLPLCLARLLVHTFSEDYCKCSVQEQIRGCSQSNRKEKTIVKPSHHRLLNIVSFIIIIINLNTPNIHK